MQSACFKENFGHPYLLSGLSYTYIYSPPFPELSAFGFHSQWQQKPRSEWGDAESCYCPAVRAVLAAGSQPEAAVLLRRASHIPTPCSISRFLHVMLCSVKAFQGCIRGGSQEPQLKHRAG